MAMPHCNGLQLLTFPIWFHLTLSIFRHSRLVECLNDGVPLATFALLLHYVTFMHLADTYPKRLTLHSLYIWSAHAGMLRDVLCSTVCLVQYYALIQCYKFMTILTSRKGTWETRDLSWGTRLYLTSAMKETAKRESVFVNCSTTGRLKPFFPRPTAALTAAESFISLHRWRPCASQAVFQWPQRSAGTCPAPLVTGLRVECVEFHSWA